MASLKKKILWLIIVFFTAVFLLGVYLIRPPEGITSEISWGVVFARHFSEELGLDWLETYLALLDDLGTKRLRLSLYWPEIEPRAGQYFFDDFDWMIEEAEKRDVKLILAIGRRLPRWPECHLPDWALSLSEEAQQIKVLDLIERIVKRYKNKSNILAWQIENEPFFKFGECPPLDVGFLEKEIALVRSLDPLRPIMLTDSGEISIWLSAARRADIFGTTIYRIVWNKYIGYFKYPLPPKFFWLKANLVHLFYPGKKIIVSELQAEPWGARPVSQTRPEEHFKSMNFEQFCDNIEYAKRVGFPEVYFWGVEWWYWLKEKQAHPEFWEKARELFSEP